MRNDSIVLIGKEFWDFVGGENTWEALIELFEEVGKDFKKKIREQSDGRI